VGSAPATRYARCGSLSIAYQDTGAGMPIVWVPGLVSHVELQRELPCLGGFARRLERFGRLVAFDKRGGGLSDRSLGSGTIEDRMDDIRAVFDACGLDRAAIVGTSEGGALSVLFAAAYPDRVSHLVLYSTYASPGLSSEELDEWCDALEAQWGTGVLAGTAVQHCDDPAVEELARLERFSCTPTMVAQRMRSDATLDIRGVLPAVRAPTLILHNREDPFIDVTAARPLVDGIPGARYIELDGDFHASWRADDYDEMIGHIQEFVTGEPASPAGESDRVLATIVFTDIVSSTAKAAQLGDHAWRSLLTIGLSVANSCDFGAAR
jgi:pimeloyl-ACP methyl ester carboxylesterase